MDEPIRGKVASILNGRELVINRGSEAGVQTGMRFAVLNSRGAEIIDPETTESLGSVEIAKTLVKVVKVQPKLAVCRTFRKFVVPGRGPFGGISSAIGQPEKTEIETLRADEFDSRKELDEHMSYVKRGDDVVQAIGEEFIE